MTLERFTPCKYGKTKRGPKCPLMAAKDGWCVHHHPATRIAKLLCQKERMQRRLDTINRVINEARAQMPFSA